MTTKVFLNDTGTELYVDCGSDIQSATVTTLKVQKPDELEYTWSGAVYQNNQIKYTIQAGDFNQAGLYYIQAYIESPTWTGRGETVTLQVFDNFGR